MARLNVGVSGLSDISEVQAWVDLLAALQVPLTTPVQVSAVSKSLAAAIDWDEWSMPNEREVD